MGNLLPIDALPIGLGHANVSCPASSGYEPRVAEQF
jgi:hypothetical protein